MGNIQGYVEGLDMWQTSNPSLAWEKRTRKGKYSRLASRWLVLSCYVIAHGFSVQVKQRRARLVRGWVTVTDRGPSLMHGFSGKIPRWVTLTYE